MRLCLVLFSLVCPAVVFAQVQQWHTHTLTFRGPEVSESAQPNPFTDYRLLVTFKHPDREYMVRGFYAADGNAAQTGADSGNVWQVRFAPDQIGAWEYKATLRRGDQIAIDDDPDAGDVVPLEHASGKFVVSAVSPRDGTGAGTAAVRDFRQRGRLVQDDAYLRFANDGEWFVKGGTNSPENLLAFADFDGTYRLQAAARDGEAAPPTEIHSYATHAADWNSGDPTWRDGKGKALIGAVNYLASVGMNSAYFLTLNLLGDGKDVWPYAGPDDFTRFDCSKLDQWEIVFEHMQSRGIILHVVTQETENERMLDDGNTGRLRKLYYRELIARFAHHPALIWNLGEENGPAEFSPNGQTSDQQKAMATYLHRTDPYQHPIVIHTHSTEHSKDELLTALLGHPPLGGLSFQVDRRERVHQEVIQWRRRSDQAGRPWLITMDEIGKWHTGALTDTQDPEHDSLRRYALWGSLMAGGAGVEWYFGAQQPHNDLNSEDWRQRANLWQQTRNAMSFFQQHLPFWEMTPADELTDREDDYCFAKPGHVYAIYWPGDGEGANDRPQLDLESFSGQFEVSWFDPQHGGPMRSGSVKEVSGPGSKGLGMPPETDAGDGQSRDWVVLVKRK